MNDIATNKQHLDFCKLLRDASSSRRSERSESKIQDSIVPNEYYDHEHELIDSMRKQRIALLNMRHLNVHNMAASEHPIHTFRKTPEGNIDR